MNEKTNKAIIIPTYNEHLNLKKLVQEINKNVFALIVIVDDSENNLTKKLIKELKGCILYLHRKKKEGRGSAVLYGLKKALEYDNIFFFIEMDADLSHRPSELKEKLKIFKKRNFDLLISSRYLKKSKIINWPFHRRILSRFSNFLAKLLLKVPISDYTNGYRIYSKRAAKLIIKNCGKIGDGFIILSEIVMVINNNRFLIGETSTVFVNRIRGKSNVNLNLLFESLIGLLKLYIISSRLKK